MGTTLQLGEDAGAQPLEDEVVFETLRNRRRRLVVHVLGAADEPLDIGTLARRIAALEHHVEPHAVSHCQRKSVYTSLHQNHLPKLADAGFVTADREWVAVRLTDRASVLEAHLQPAEEGGVATDQFWLVALGTGVVTTAAVAALPASSSPAIWAAALAALAATAVTYWSFSRSPGK